MMFKLIVLCMLFLQYTFSPIIACSCVEGISISQAFQNSDQVFIGTAVSVQDVDEMIRKIIFDIEENFKGPLPLSRSIPIYTYTMESMCGLDVQENEKWQIWAYKSYETPEQLKTNWCTKSTTSVLENIDFLRQQESSGSHQEQSFLMLVFALVVLAFIIFQK